jgi:hypothetical protein
MVSGALAGVSTLLLIGIGWGIGLRLLWIARRTRGLPELTLGTGIFLIGGLGYPLAIASNALGATRPALAGLCLVSSATLCHVGLTAHCVFTWKVFRPAAAWARGLTGLSMLAVAIGFGGNLRIGLALSSATVTDAQPWTLFLVTLGVLTFAWSGIEALAYHVKLRRRLALGLADPVVADRFLLWGVASLASSFASAANLFFALTSPLSVLDPAALAISGACSLVSAAVMLLTFVPPARYLRFVAARHAARTAPTA